MPPGGGLSRRELMASVTGAALLGAAGLEAGCGDGGDGKKVPEHWHRIGPVADLPVDGYAPDHIVITGGDGKRHSVTFYVRATRPAVPGGPQRVIAVSSLCTHKGCPTRYVAVSRKFICPCHGGVFRFDGSVFGGPPPRGLDRGNTAVRDGIAYLVPRSS